MVVTDRVCYVCVAMKVCGSQYGEWKIKNTFWKA